MINDVKTIYKVIVIGGSMAGLSTGLALSCMGIAVDIYEGSSTMERRGAGIAVQQDMMAHLIRHGITPQKLIGIAAPIAQVLNRQGELEFVSPNGQAVFTSWNHIWKQMKTHFPKDQFHFNQRVQNIGQNDDHAYVDLRDGSRVYADLLIGADGYHSIVRKSLFPQLEPIYAGYAAFRGLISETMMSPEDIKLLGDKLSIFDSSGGRMMSYTVPGWNGEQQRGNRLLNWVWAVNLSAVELKRMTLDVDGHQHRFSIPPGKMSSIIREELIDRADRELPVRLADQIRKTEEPFLQAILDL